MEGSSGIYGGSSGATTPIYSGGHLAQQFFALNQIITGSAKPPYFRAYFCKNCVIPNQDISRVT